MNELIKVFSLPGGDMYTLFAAGATWVVETLITGTPFIAVLVLLSRLLINIKTLCKGKGKD